MSENKIRYNLVYKELEKPIESSIRDMLLQVQLVDDLQTIVYILSELLISEWGKGWNVIAGSDLNNAIRYRNGHMGVIKDFKTNLLILFFQPPMGIGEIPSQMEKLNPAKQCKHINVVDSKMEEDFQKRVCKHVDTVLSSDIEENNIPKMLRSILTYYYGPQWHVVIGKGTIFTYDFNYYVHDQLILHIGNYMIAIWRQMLEEMPKDTLYTPILQRAIIPTIIFLIGIGFAIYYYIRRSSCDEIIKNCSPFFGCRSTDYSNYSICKQSVQYLFYAMIACLLLSAILRRYQKYVKRSIEKNKKLNLLSIIRNHIKLE
ncbi:hypothetical protein WA158_008454 [Blastocystis sp. Blastoise]